MGLLGNLFTLHNRHNINKESKKARKIKEQRLSLARELLNINMRLSRTELQEQLVRAGRQHDPLGGTLRHQQEVGFGIRERDLQLGESALKIEREQQKAADTQNALSGIDAVLGAVLGSSGEPNDPQPGNQTKLSAEQSAAQAVLEGVNQVRVGNTQAALQAGGAVGGLFGRTSTGAPVSTAGVAATPTASAFSSGGTTPGSINKPRRSILEGGF